MPAEVCDLLERDGERYCKRCREYKAIAAFGHGVRRFSCKMHRQTAEYRKQYLEHLRSSMPAGEFAQIYAAYKRMFKDAGAFAGAGKNRLTWAGLRGVITGPGQYVVPADPTRPLAADNVAVLDAAWRRRQVVELWRRTRDAAQYRDALDSFRRAAAAPAPLLV